jgi:DNA-directed RNA polymerase subunit RPC12/RpoP
MAQDVGLPAPAATISRGFTGAAKRATIARMDWHPTPKDDAWRQAHLAMLKRLGKDAWLRCDGCAHTVMVKPRDFAEHHRLDMLTLLLTISRRMRCTRCGARKGGCRPAPHDTRGP